MIDLDQVALDAARQLTPANDVQARTAMQCAILAAIRNAQSGQRQGPPSVQTSPTVPRDALDALASAWIEQAGLHEQNALEADSIGGMKMSVAINEARMSERLSAALALKSVLSSYQLMAAGWSGWATQKPGRMPKLWGAREIAELNHDPTGDACLIFLSEQPAQAVNLGQLPYGIRLIKIPARNSLDPIDVFVQDYELGRGRIVVTCYGQAWCGFWGAMGDRTVMQFVASCNADYVAGSMLSGRHEFTSDDERTYVVRIATEVIAEFRALIDNKAVQL